MTEPRTFRPTIQDDGTVRAGGVCLGRVDRESGHLVRRDRYLRRCTARGTEDVRVDLVEFLEVIMAYIVSSS